MPSSGKIVYYWSHFKDAEVKIQRFGDWPEASIPPAAPVAALTLSLSLFPPQSPVQRGDEPARDVSSWTVTPGRRGDLQPSHLPGPGSSRLTRVPAPVRASCRCRALCRGSRGAQGPQARATDVPAARILHHGDGEVGRGEWALLLRKRPSETSFRKARGFSVSADVCVVYKYMMYLEKFCSIYQ